MKKVETLIVKYFGKYTFYSSYLFTVYLIKYIVFRNYWLLSMFLFRAKNIWSCQGRLKKKKLHHMEMIYRGKPHERKKKI